MRRFMRATLLGVGFMVLGLMVITTARAAEWETYTSSKYDVKFQLPSDWKVEEKSDVKGRVWSGISPDNSMGMMLTVFENETHSARELFDAFLPSVEGMELDEESVEEEEDSVVGVCKDEDTVAIVVAAAEQDVRDVLMLTSNLDQFEANKPTFDQILESIGSLED